MNKTSTLRVLLPIKAMVIANLVIGFVVAVVIPRLAIERLGVDNYGIYALIVGFAGIIAFSDLGVQPGLMRALSEPLANGQYNLIKAVLRKVFRLALWIWLVLLVICGGLVLFSVSGDPTQAIHTLVAFSIASFLFILGDIYAALIRVSGRIFYTYLLRIGYLLLYLAITVALYLFLPKWDGVWLLCYAQLLASIPYAFMLWHRFQAQAEMRHGAEISQNLDKDLVRIWKESWRISTPERLNRVLQLIAGAIERPLMIATTGAALVTSYDLLIRLSLIVSALPAAINQPLLAMLSHDRVRHERDQRFLGAEIFTRIIGAFLALSGLIIAFILWRYFHVALFSIDSQIPVGVALLVFSVTAINVLTAPGVTVCMVQDNVGPVNVKMTIEFLGIFLGSLLAIWKMNGLLFVIVRNIAIGFSALIFMRQEYLRKCAKNIV